MNLSNFEEDLYFWFKLGSCRQSELARQLGVTRQYVNNAVSTDITLSDEQKERFYRAMSRVETREAKCKSKVEKNILKCAKNSYSLIAREKMKKWIDIYKEMI